MRRSAAPAAARRRRSRLAPLLALLAGITLPAPALARFPARLVRDIDPLPAPNGLSPEGFHAAGEATFFFASTPQTGRELWKTDGTAEGTALVRDILPGAGSGVESLLGVPGHDAVAVVSGTLYFAASDGLSFSELWRSDGTEAGTYPLFVDPPSALAGSGSGPAWLTEKDGQLYAFLSTLAFPYAGLWRIDPPHGQAEQLLNVPLVSNLLNVSGTLYFGIGNALWKSDGTRAGTVEVADKVPGPALFSAGGRLFLTTSVNVAAGDLWTSDGTDAGTVPLKNIFPGPAQSGPRDFTDLNGTTLFAATDPVAGRELWKTDGTPDGTVLLKDIRPGAASSGPGPLAVLDGRVFFGADDGTAGQSLWKSDGTADGTELVRAVGAGAMGLGRLTVWNGILYFAVFGGSEPGLWRSDGTPAGTYRIKALDLPRQIPDAAFAVAGSALVFRADDPALGRQLWRSDGTEQGTVVLQDLAPTTASSGPSSLFPLGGATLFSAHDSTTGREVWKTDGTEAGTLLVKDLQPGPADSLTGGRTGAPGFTQLGSNALFFSRDALWTTDGSEAGTLPLRALRVAGFTADGAPSSGRLGDRLFFYAHEGALGTTALWTCDGTATGTSAFEDLMPPPSPAPFAALTEALLFPAAPAPPPGPPLPPSSAPRSGLWRTDGTDGGTSSLFSLRIDDLLLSQLVSLNGGVFFDGRAGLGRSDGTPAGTVVLAPNGRSPVAVGEAVFFVNDVFGKGAELWKSDGTVSGTGLVKDIADGSLSSLPLPLRRISPLSIPPFPSVDLNGALLFAPNDHVHGVELWRSDGTDAGTVLVKDIAPGPASSFPSSFVAVDGQAVFQACDGAGCELWASDGTEAGTRRLVDLEPGRIGSNPTGFTVSGSDLLFAATTAEVGTELWALPRAALFDLDLDGVADADDRCPDTPADAAVSPEGCTAEQLVALRCPPGAGHAGRRGGGRASCVAAVANEAVRLGLIAPSEKHLLVREAARP